MPDRIRVWYLIGSLAVGGTERTLVDLVSALDRERFDPVIWTVLAEGPLADEVPEDVPVRSLDAANKFDLRAALRFLVAVRRERPHVLQSFLFFDNVLARIAGAFCPSTTTITGVREVPEQPVRHRQVVDRAMQFLSDIVISNSHAGAAFTTGYGVPEEKVRVVWNGRQIDRIAGATPTISLVDELDIERHATIVGTVGRLVEIKGHFDLIEAWPTVLDSEPNANLVVVGDGPERSALEALVKSLDVEHRVHLLGRRDDIPELLDQFDLFVFPSHHEGHPGALLEAMAAGLPIVATPVGGSSELVHDGEHGVHVPPKTPSVLAQEIVALLSDPEGASDMGRRAQERARSTFDLETMVDRYEAIYRSACHQESNR